MDETKKRLTPIDIIGKLNDINRGIFDLSVRVTGRTTRLVDEYIQKLYTNRGEFVPIIDHYGTRGANELLASKILKRMELEHKKDPIDIRRYGDSETPEIKLISVPDREYVEEEIKRLLEIKMELLIANKQ